MNNSTLLDAIEKISVAKPEILVCGDVMLDKYWAGDTTRVSPEAPIPIVKLNDISNLAGGAANVALNIKSLSANIKLLGLVGEDPSASDLQNLLDKASIPHDFFSHPDFCTITKLRVMSRHQQLLRIDQEEYFSEAREAALLAQFEQDLKKSQVVILVDYNKGTLQNIQKFIRLAKAHGVLCLIDPKQQNFEVYRGASILTPNLLEFELLVGKKVNQDNLAQEAQTILKKYDIGALLITQAEDGMTLIQANQEAKHIPALLQTVFDVTGAGDTVIAALACALASGVSLEQAAIIANAAASLVIKKLGTATVDLQELQILLGKNRAGVIHSLSHLFELVNAARSKGEKIVFTNGCFDLLHPGHVEYLAEAKLCGQRLIVALNSDESVKRLKGSTRPIHNLKDRMSVIANLKSVDWVIDFNEDTPLNLIQAINPDVLVKGGDYTDASKIVGAQHVQEQGGIVKLLSFNQKHSTSKTLEIIKKVNNQDENISVSGI